MKVVRIEGHSFDCAPGHVIIVGRGAGSNLRIALHEAVRNMLGDKRIFGKRIHSFKLDVVVVPAEKKS